jgi:tripartite-type tricarboxylate transporter receptor subunit TctC
MTMVNNGQGSSNGNMIKTKKDGRNPLTVGLSMAVLVLTLLSGNPGDAQNFTNKPTRLIVPFAAGSGVDLVARAIQPYVEKPLGARLILENVPGADSRIGLAKIYKAHPDGYTIGIHGFPAPIISENLFKVGYESAGFSFIYAWTMNPQLIFVAEDSWKTFDDFMLDARKRQLTLGLPGYGTVSHLLALALEKHMNVKFKFVPFSGSAEGLAPLAGKHIDANIGSTDAALGMVRAKKIRPILIWAFHPDPNFPEIPLSGKYNAPTIVMTRGVFGPPNILPERAKILEKAFSKAAAEPKLAEWAKSRGMDLVSLNAEQYRQEVEKQQLLVKDYKELLKAP